MSRVPLLVLFAVLSAALPVALARGDTNPAAAIANPAAAGATQIPPGVWDGKLAMGHIAAQLTFGSRALDTAGHERTVEYIENVMTRAKAASVTGQQWIDTGGNDLGHALLSWAHIGGGSTRHALVNIVARFYPDNPRRIILGTHYDSIVRAYRDRDHPDGPMPGANNSASGVAVLLQTARALAALPPPPVGIDFVFFDGEEGPKSLGAGDPQWRPLGSPYFAEHLGDFYPDRKPEVAILFDMVCTRNLVLNPEPQSLASANSQVARFWDLGRKTAPAVFAEMPYSAKIDDDHDALIKTGIPSFLVIDFKYDPWFNTTEDTIDKCSAASLEVVGRTLLQYIYTM
jgi:glutaminyl-peptide cyclotransferase